MTEPAEDSRRRQERVRQILAEVRRLAVEYYALTGKPLGVTGEVTEAVAAKRRGLELVEAWQAGYDALRGNERIQIKGRALSRDAKALGKLGRIKRDAACDTVMLAILDRADMEAREIWEAPYGEVCVRLNEPGSKGRERGELMVRDFKRLPSARRIWPPAG